MAKLPDGRCRRGFDLVPPQELSLRRQKAFTIKDTIRMPKPPGARVVNASSQARESNNRGEKPPPPPRHGKAIIEARNPDTATEQLHHGRCSPRQPGAVPGTVPWSRYR